MHFETGLSKIKAILVLSFQSYCRLSVEKMILTHSTLIIFVVFPLDEITDVGMSRAPWANQPRDYFRSILSVTLRYADHIRWKFQPM